MPEYKIEPSFDERGSYYIWDITKGKRLVAIIFEATLVNNFVNNNKEEEELDIVQE